MFDILRKKFASVVKKTEKKIKKTVKSVKKTIKKEITSSKKSNTKKDKESKKKSKEKVEKVEPVEQIEENTDEVKEEFSFFSKIKTYLSTSKLTKDKFDEAFHEMEITLLENNVALEAVDSIRESLEEQLVGKEIKKDKIDETLIESLKNSILSVLHEPKDILKLIKEKEGPFVILFFGINGTGKTTSIAKLAHFLKKRDISCVVAGADTFRAAAIEQLKTHADKIGVPMISGNYNADPASVAYEAIENAKKNGKKVVLIDTAGRMYTKDNLMREMEKIVRVSKPDLKIFVGESITGNDAIDQVKTFNETIGIDGIILTKADVDEKAGTILSVSKVTEKPIFFLGTGQEYTDFEPFTKKTVLKNLGIE